MALVLLHKLLQQTWDPPDATYVKLNVDGSFLQQDNSAAWGAILRDHRGVVLGSAWSTIENCIDADMAEASACLHGIQALRHLSPLPIIVECDSSSVIQAINNKETERSAITGCIAHVKRLVAVDPDPVDPRSPAEDGGADPPRLDPPRYCSLRVTTPSGRQCEAEEAKRLGLAMTDAEAEAWSAKEAAREAAEKNAGKRPKPEVKVEPITLDSDDAYLADFRLARPFFYFRIM
ncbi:hypothetical protein BRADI_3g28170v3 [Brachypodium distachyon]|uniref:RNase H type-1 domain-containing protein n=1 Tax=Brachypodium distachyon TaxID=15368 RepID=I1I4I2_BRADI|nr:hypothetical protein BRADI_3g28170v3 [Brachypodium distachyon]